jgi:hypothetical protein
MKEGPLLLVRAFFEKEKDFLLEKNVHDGKILSNSGCGAEDQRS